MECAADRAPENSSTAGTAAGDRLTPFELFCCLFTEVKPGEGATALAMFCNVLLIMVAYYLVKPLREGWLSYEQLDGFSKMEVRALTSYGQGILLLLVVLIYDHLVGRWPRGTLITRSILFCMANLIIFRLLHPGWLVGHIPGMGILFYLWVGIFGDFVVAQIWAFAVDLYNDERGRRMLPLIAIGATGGSVLGSWLVDQLLHNGRLSVENLLLCPLLPLACAILISRSVDRANIKNDPGFAPGCLGVIPPRGRALHLVFSNHFLLSVGIITMLLNWVTTNSDNLLYRVIIDMLDTQYADLGVDQALPYNVFLRDGVTAFYGDFFFWVNACALVLQALVASRLLRYGGIAAIILLLPLIVLTSSLTIILLPILAVIKVMKIAENAANYSINNTARQVIWLPMSLEVKLKAKTVIDSLFARVGDGLAAATILLGVKVFAFTTQHYFILNLVLVCFWLAGVLFIAREHRRLTTEREAAYAFV